MILPSFMCVCCNLNLEESMEHLFLECPFAQACWSTIQLQTGTSQPFVELESLRNQLNVPFFMDTVVLFSWCIWMQRNDFIFKGLQPHPDNCLAHFKREFSLVILRAKSRHKSLMLARKPYCNLLYFFLLFFFFS